MVTTVLITGANRGIGFGFVTACLSRPDHVVIAAVRNPEHPSSIALSSLPTASGSKLLTVKLDAASPTDAQDAVSHLQAQHSITSLDIVIANAAIAPPQTPALSTPADSLLLALQTNTMGPILLASACAPLLRAAASANRTPKLIVISSLGGSSTVQPMIWDATHLPGTPYGMTKAAVNWWVRKVHLEEEWLVAFAVHPGFVATDMVARDREVFEKDGIKAIEVAESVEGIMGVIDAADREGGGKFVSWKGEELPF
ncbi:Short chain dehydrogenase-like protein 7 [Elsinoe fawcettii]|nr:Short chain dehydrogenase-like protein 7 [Elsinoe fawcettii]